MPQIVIYILILLFSFSHTCAQERKYTVVIDAGHGGFDPGTNTKSGIKEKDINLYVAKFIALNIEEIYPEINVILSRENDIFIPLKKRPLYAKILDADLFISIHCNHNKKTYAKGLEIYIQNGVKVKGSEHQKRAENYGRILNKVITQKLNYPSRGIKYENFSVLRNSIEFVPSVLIELGFFSNEEEAKYLTSKKGINGLSLAIAKSINLYFDKM